MKKIVIIPNISKDEELKITEEVVSFLKDKAVLYMDSEFEKSGLLVNYLDKSVLFDEADYVIVLGGDGTILNVCGPCGEKNIPVMGINLGRVGFMTEVKVSDINKACRCLINDEFKIEKRMMMRVDIVKDNKVTKSYTALNDAVISKISSPMISIEIHSEKEKINQYQADGLILSTPTGSTGYSLSAGGPVCDPTMELFIASPICAHMLHARPALIPSNKEIELMILDDLGKEAIVTIDGNVSDKINANDKVIIRKSDNYMSIIKFGNQSFYDVLIDKLK